MNITRIAKPLFRRSPTTTACLVILLAASAWADPPTYRVDYLGAGWTGTGMNELGDVCGSLNVDGTRMRAGISRGGQPFELLPLPPGMETSRAFDINDAGVIVGAVCPNMYVTTQPTAAVWRPTAGGYDIEVLGGLPGDQYSIAWAVNNVGDIIGASGFWGWNPDHPILYTAGGPTPLPGGWMAYDINDQRVVVSGNRLRDLDDGTVTDIPLPPGTWQGVISGSLNNNDDFGGYIQGYSSCSVFPIRYRQGVGWEFLGGCAPTAASVSAINDHGDALSYYYQTAAGVNFVGEGYRSLGSLIDPSQGVWFLTWGGANAINNAHQIVAGGMQGTSGPIGTLRLTPINALRPGDLNCDGTINPFDINGFLLALSDPAGYGQAYPNCDVNNADVDQNGTVNPFDIQPFIALLGG